MFVEKLKKEDFVQFIKEITNGKFFMISGLYDTTKLENYKVEDGKVTFNNTYIKFVFTDFNFTDSGRENRIVPQKEYSKRWLKFMYERFGEQYKSAFLAHRKELRSDALKNFASSYDENTKKYADELTK